MKNFLLLLVCVPAFACTDFLLMSQEGDAVVGRSMEFGINIQSEVLVQPSGEKMQSRVFDNQKGLSWQVQYGYIGLTAFGEDWIVDGLNEEGLSIGGLWFPGAQYPQVNEKEPSTAIALEDVTAWLLSTCKTVAEVKRAIPKVQIWAHELAALKQEPPMHLAISDRTGKSIAVEFLNGKVEIIDNPTGVLTNAPKLEWHLTNLNNYMNLSAIQKGEVRFDGMVLKAAGEGFGMLGLPGDWTPPSRFVRIANFKHFANQVKGPEETVNLAFHLLNTVDIPYGVVRSEQEEHYDYTQWVVVKDLVNGVLYLRTYQNLNVIAFRMDQMMGNSKMMRKMPIRGAGH